MVLYKDAIYCVGLHTGKGEIRTFLLDRMRDTESSALERFELPPDFKVDDYFQGGFGIWRGSEKIKVVIDFDASVAELVRIAAGPRDAEARHPCRRNPAPHDDGGRPHRAFVLGPGLGKDRQGRRARSAGARGELAKPRAITKALAEYDTAGPKGPKVGARPTPKEVDRRAERAAPDCLLTSGVGSYSVANMELAIAEGRTRRT